MKSPLFRMVPLVLAALAVVLVVVNGVLLLFNQSLQTDINARQQFINQSAGLGRINQALIRALAASATTNKDDRLTDLLSRQGLQVQVTPNAAAPQAPAAAAAAAPAPAAAATPNPARKGN